MQTKKEAREWFEENHQLFDETDKEEEEN